MKDLAIKTIKVIGWVILMLLWLFFVLIALVSLPFAWLTNTIYTESCKVGTLAAAIAYVIAHGRPINTTNNEREITNDEQGNE